MRTTHSSCIVLLSLCLTVGCHRSQSHDSTNMTGKSSSWSDQGPPGLQSGCVTYEELNVEPSKKEAVVIWSDLTGMNGEGRNNRGYYIIKGAHYRNDGPRVEYQIQTTNDKSLTVAIDGRTYDLSKGSVFLISTQGTRPTVKQIEMDALDFPHEMVGVKGDIEALKRYAHETDTIREFFESHQSSTAAAE